MFPIDKVTKLIALPKQACACQSLALCEWQVLLGHLNFACKVVVPGRDFTRRLHN